MRNKSFLLCPFLLCLASCYQDTLMHEYQHIDERGWGKRDTLAFHLPAVEENGAYNVEVGMRITSQFPYDALWLVVESTTDGILSTQKDTIKYELAHGGKALSGQGLTLLQYEQPCLKVSLKKGQESDIRVYHIMSKERLPYVTDLGICVRP